MPAQAVLLPVFAQMALTFGLWFWMAYLRVTLVRRGVVNSRDVALREPNWPPHVRQVINAAHNQIETPLLFYAITILAVVMRQADLLFVVLAWVYVVVRLLHAYIHVTSNRVSLRGPLFGGSLMALFVMWIVLMVHVFDGTS
jgi:hypothetical protein